MKVLKRQQVKIALLATAVVALFLLVVGLGQIELEPGLPLERILAFLIAQFRREGTAGVVPPLGGGDFIIDLFRAIFLVALVLFPIGLVLVLLDPDARRRLLGTLIRMALLMALLSFLVSTREEELGFEGQEGLGMGPRDEFEFVEPLTPEAFSPTSVSPWIGWGLSLLAGLVVALVVYSVVNHIRKNRAAEAQLEQLARQAEAALVDLEAGGDYQDTIIRCYAEMSRIVREERGLHRDRAMTAREFVDYLLRARLPNAPVRRLTQLFEAARYGAGAHTPEDEEDAVASLRAIVAAVREGR